KMNKQMIIKQASLSLLLITAVFFNACASKTQYDIIPAKDDKNPVNTTEGKTYQVKNAAELSALALEPGDKVVMQNGNWQNQQLVFKAKGTEQKPITLVAEAKGKVILSGNSNLVIDGEWLIVDGLVFRDGYLDKGHVIQFTAA